MRKNGAWIYAVLTLALISGLTEKMQGLSVPDGSSADKTLEEIRSLMTGLNDQVKTVSDTLTRLSKEA